MKKQTEYGGYKMIALHDAMKYNKYFIKIPWIQ